MLTILSSIKRFLSPEPLNVFKNPDGRLLIRDYEGKAGWKLRLVTDDAVRLDDGLDGETFKNILTCVP